MKTIRLLIIALLCQCVCSFAQSDIAAGVRSVVRLDEGWRFSFGNAADPSKDFGCGTEYFNYLTKANSIHNEGPYAPTFNDSAWTEVRIPHDWVAQLPYAPSASHSHGYKTVGFRYPSTSVGWYRKTVEIPASDYGRHIELRFDGIFRDARVWFNGFYMGSEPSGYATQVYDVTEYVNYGGANLICVRADATLEEGWYYEGAGIYRDVWLTKSSPVGVSSFGTFVHSELRDSFTAATIAVETEIRNSSLEFRQCTVEQRLFDAEGRQVACTGQPASFRLKAKERVAGLQNMLLDKPHLWSVDDPYLYTVQTIVKVDGAVVDIYETTTGIREVRFDASKGFLLNGRQLKLKGVNMHQDHAGVGTALPDSLVAWRVRQLKALGCNAYRSSHNPASPVLLDICDREGILVIDENRLAGINDHHRRLLENMIRRDRNHPCIVLWSDGNEEWGMENTVQGTRIAAAMREYTRLLDPTRQSTIANAGGSEMIKGLDVVGFNYIIQNDVDNRKRNNPSWKIVGTEETTGCGTRGVYFMPADSAGSQSAQGQMPSINRSVQPGVENVIERGWQFYADRPWAAGLFYWTGFDYRGEPNPLSYPAHDSQFGILDYCGFPKDEAWYLKSWWTDEPTLHIFPHWNLTGHDGEDVEMWAYSNCDEVELTVNGKKLGRQRMPRGGHLKWKTVYKPGRVVAVGYKNGRRVITQTLETTGPAAKVVMSADRHHISADGHDVCVVTVQLQDSCGRFVPDASPLLDITLEGNGRILGTGNGNPSYLGADHPAASDCRQFHMPAFNGLAQIIVQSGKSPSALVLSCKSEGLKSASLTIDTQACHQ